MSLENKYSDKNMHVSKELSREGYLDFLCQQLHIERNSQLICFTEDESGQAQLPGFSNTYWVNWMYGIQDKSLYPYYADLNRDANLIQANLSKPIPLRSSSIDCIILNRGMPLDWFFSEGGGSQSYLDEIKRVSKDNSLIIGFDYGYSGDFDYLDLRDIAAKLDACLLKDKDTDDRITVEKADDLLGLSKNHVIQNKPFILVRGV